MYNMIHHYARNCKIMDEVQGVRSNIAEIKQFYYACMIQNSFNKTTKKYEPWCSTSHQNLNCFIVLTTDEMVSIFKYLEHMVDYEIHLVNNCNIPILHKKQLLTYVYNIIYYIYKTYYYN